jgi:hypothetical protein
VAIVGVVVVWKMMRLEGKEIKLKGTNEEGGETLKDIEEVN